MWFYWCITAAAAIFVSIASACFFKKNKKLSQSIVGIIMFSIAVLIFCLVAAFRDPYLVGTDTKWYGIWDFRDAKDLSLETFATMPRINRYSMIQKFLIWIVSYTSKNFFVYLFIYELWITLPFLLVILLYLKKSAWLGVVVYGCLIYPSTFNAMRQFQAEAFCLLAVYLLTRDKPIKAVIAFLMGLVFHTSALVMLPIFPIYYYLKWNNKIGLKNIYVKCFVLIGFAIIGCVFFSKPIFQFLFAHSETYRAYVNETPATGYALVTFYSVFFVLFSLMLLLFKTKKENKSYEIYYLLVLCLIGVIAFSLGLSYKWLFRLGWYYFAAFVIFFPRLINAIDDKHEAMFLSIVVVIFLLSFSYFNYDYTKHEEVVPYVFSDNINIRL